MVRDPRPAPPAAKPKGKRPKGAGKGADFERIICKRLSRWLTRGLREDLFWRSAMSGGRATVRFQRGGRPQQQIGDICAIDPIGHRLTDLFMMECKFRAKLYLHGMTMEQYSDGIRPWWDRTVLDARQHVRMPMLICKANQTDTYVVVNRDGAAWLQLLAGTKILATFPQLDAYMLRFEDFYTHARRP